MESPSRPSSTSSRFRRALYEKCRMHRSLWEYSKQLSELCRHVRDKAVEANAQPKNPKSCRTKLTRQYGDAEDRNGNLFTSLISG